MTSEARLAGVLPVFQTPYAANGEPALGVLESELRLAADEVTAVAGTACRASPLETAADRLRS